MQCEITVMFAFDAVL